MSLQHKIDAEIKLKLAWRWIAVWSELWQRDRDFSLILRLLNTTLKSQASSLTLSNDDTDLESFDLFLRDLDIVMKHIIHHDQDFNDMTYLITLKIEEELQECQSIMSVEWWDFTLSSDTLTNVLCDMYVTKMRFHIIWWLFHLSFLLKSFKNTKYLSSKLISLQSSRKMINVYNVLWNEKKLIFKTCKMIDFQIFVAAMTLVFNLLVCLQSLDHSDLHREERDWQLVLQIAAKLRWFFHSTKECKVAALNAHVLNDFFSLHKAFVEKICKVDISYFDRIEIQRLHSRLNEYCSYTHDAAWTINQQQI